MTLTQQRLVALFVGTLVGCSATDPEGNPGSGGTSSGSAGTSSAAGTSTSAGASGTATTAGSGGTGASMAGTSNGGSPGMSGSGGAAAGSGGSSMGGHAGSSGSAAGGMSGSGGGSGGGSTGTPNPSAGCGKAGKPERVSKASEEIIDFPASYDGMKPVPLLVALHACGNQNTQWENLTKGTAFESEYVRLMPNTTDSGQCWNTYSKNIARILQQYDDVLANYCIDKNRVFGIGHSSGAQMLVNILSHKDDANHLNFKGVSPVAADPYNVAVPMPVLYIDGQKDNQRSADSAKNTVAKFRAANMCMDTSMPYSAIMGCKSHQDQSQVDPGCIIYDKCTVPTIWCSHNDPDYSNTQHGVPCFGVTAMIDFFKTL